MRWFLQGTSVSYTTCNWLVTTKLQYGKNMTKIEKFMEYHGPSPLAEWSRTLLLTARYLSLLHGLECVPVHARTFPVT